MVGAERDRNSSFRKHGQERVSSREVREGSLEEVTLAVNLWMLCVQENRLFLEGYRPRSFFFYKIFFLFFKCGLFLKPLLNLLQHCFCFMFLEGFSPEACGILALWPGIKPSFPALKGKVLTTGPSGIFLGQTLEPVTWGHSRVCAGVTASSPP